MKCRTKPALRAVFAHVGAMSGSGRKRRRLMTQYAVKEKNGATFRRNPLAGYHLEPADIVLLREGYARG